MNIPEHREYRTVRDGSPRGLSFGVWLLLVVAGCVLVPLARCQVDIQAARPDQAYIVLARNAQWGQSGASAGDCSMAGASCGVNNNFLFPALYAQESICVTIFNTSTSTATFNLLVAGSNDPAITKFQVSQSRWSVPIAPDGTTATSGAATINAGAWAQFYFQSAGAARIALVLSASTVINGGADIVVSQSLTNAYTSNPGSIVSSVLASLPPTTGFDTNGVAYNPQLFSRNINCFVGGQVVGCFPTFAITLASSPNRNALAVDAGAVGANFTGVAASAPFVSVGGVPIPLAGDASGDAFVASPSTLLDPCQNSNITKSSAVITAGAAATTQIVGLVSGKQIFVCGYQMSQATLAGTLQWTSGTGVNCAAGVVAKTGAMQTIVGQPFTYGPGASLFIVVAGSELCLTTTGAGATASGVVSYVQQ